MKKQTGWKSEAAEKEYRKWVSGLPEADRAMLDAATKHHRKLIKRAIEWAKDDLKRERALGRKGDIEGAQHNLEFQESELYRLERGAYLRRLGGNSVAAVLGLIKDDELVRESIHA